MLAMQYTIQLAEDYDTGLIRKRVEERSKLFDALPGLAHKSYLLNEADRIYAPFYVWEDMAEARNFMLNDLFRGVIKTFSRPRIRTWTILDRKYGNKNLTPGFAVREIDVIPPEENLEEMFERELAIQATLMAHEDLHYHIIAVDPDRWEIMRYSLWASAESAGALDSDCIQTYEVLHLSEPPKAAKSR